MSGLDDVELANFENLYSQLERAVQNGLADRISFLSPYMAAVKNQIDQLLPNGITIDRDKDETKKRNEANLEAAAMVMEQRVNLNSYINDGFGSTKNLLNFAECLNNDDFFNEVQSKSSEEQKKLMQNWYDEATEKLGAKKRDEVIESTPNLKKLLKDNNVNSITSDNKALEELKKPLEKLADKEIVAKVEDLQSKNDKRLQAAGGDTNQKATKVSEEYASIKEDRRLAAKEVRDRVHDVAKKNDIANNVGEQKKEVSQEDAMFAELIAKETNKEDIKRLQAGVGAEITSKPTEVQIADAGKTNDAGRGKQC